MIIKKLLLPLIALNVIMFSAMAEDIPFTDENCIRAAVGEASGEGYNGLLAVCCALRNRKTLRGVYGFKTQRREPERVWEIARKAWEESKDKDIVGGAGHWENITAFGKPYWTKSMQKTVTIGAHTFYKEVE